MTRHLRRNGILLAAAMCTLTACQGPMTSTERPEPAPVEPLPSADLSDTADPAGTADTAATAATPEGVIAAPPPAAEDTSKRLTAIQLRARVRAFADQYRSVIADACDEIKHRRSDPELRRKAHQLKIDGATAMYDIAVDPSARAAMLDMLVLVTLQSYLATAQSEATFPEDHELVRAKTEQLRADAWRLASQVMSEQQRTELLEIINRWWAANSAQTDIWYVRIANFAAYSRGTAFEGLFDNVKGIPSGILNAFVPLKDATSSLDEATAIAERATWLAPRQMILAQWRAEAIILETLATTQVEDVLEAVEGFEKTASEVTSVAKGLPGQVTATQKELLSGLAENEQMLRNLLEDAQSTIGRVEALTAETGSTIDEGEQLVKATEEAIASVDAVVRSVDGLVARLAVMQTEKLEAEAGRPPAEPFEIAGYTEAINALNEVLQETNALVSNVEASTEPTVLASRVQAVRAEGESFVDHVSGQVLRLIVAAGIALAGAGILIVLAAKLIPGRRAAAG